MISYHNGDLLESGCDIICHQVNLQGVMGGGLALQIAIKYPDCERVYKEYLDKHKGGQVLFYILDKHHLIANCFSQNKDFTTNYEWVKSCFSSILKMAKQEKLKTIGVPFKYGCGIASGDWNKVEQIFKDIFKNQTDIEFQIWKL